MSIREISSLLFSAMADESWRVRKEAVDVFVVSKPDEAMVNKLLELLRSDDNAGLRNSAAEAVIKLGNSAVPPLIRLVHDPDVDVRKFIIDVMGAIGSPDIYRHLLTALDDSDVNVAAAAAEHLGNLGDARAVPELIRSIVSNTADFFRFNALAAIGKLAAPAPVPDDIKQLADNNILRKAVYACLGSIADESAVPMLVDGMASRQKSSRKAAVIALHKIFVRSSPDARRNIEATLQSMNGGATVPLLMDLFDPSNPVLCEALVVTLNIIRDIRIVDVLLKAFANERLSAISVKALKHLGPDGMQALISRFTGATEESRSAICTLIGECGFRAGGAIICNALADSCAAVRTSAVHSAGKLGLTDSIPGVVKLLDDNDNEVKNAVIACLRSLALLDRTAIQVVARQMGSSEQTEHRRNAAILYAALGDGDRLSLLIKDEDALVRQAAVTSIGKLRLKSDAGILLIALADEDPDVRIAAAEALGEVGDATVVTALMHALNDEDAWVQNAVLKALDRIAPDKVFDAIQSVFHQADGLVKITCLELLDRQESLKSLQLVEESLESSDSEVVKQAVTILAHRAIDRIFSNAESLLSHPAWDVRVACSRAVALLPASQAAGLLSHALEQESNELVRAQLNELLKGLA
jgi:HEAT repeat protein